ncbi:MAG: glycosyltransferase family 2 protein [Patescibacteria group bacterium]
MLHASCFMPPRVAIIIVAYNARPYLENCFNSLALVSYPRAALEIIVVDNASTDGTADWLHEHAASATLIRNHENLGFAGGNNVGIRHAFARGAEFVYLLNQDTIVEPDFLNEAVAVAQTDQKIGAAQSFLLLHPDRDRVNSMGNAIHFLGFGYTRGYRMLVSAAEEEIERWRKRDPLLRIAYCSGAGVLLRASALKEIGLFDEELFLYHEDLDLGWRLCLAGYGNVLAPRSVVYHQYEFSRSISKWYWMERNRFLVLAKNYHLATLILILPALIIMEFGLLAFSFRSGWWREKLKGYAYLARPHNWRALLRKRRDVQQRRRVSEREIVRFFTGIVASQEVMNPILRYFANPIFQAYWSIVRRVIFW